MNGLGDLCASKRGLKRSCPTDRAGPSQLLPCLCCQPSSYPFHKSPSTLSTLPSSVTSYQSTEYVEQSQAVAGLATAALSNRSMSLHEKVPHQLKATSGTMNTLLPGAPPNFPGKKNLIPIPQLLVMRMPDLETHDLCPRSYLICQLAYTFSHHSSKCHSKKKD